jgi:hypothetical protein
MSTPQSPAGGARALLLVGWIVGCGQDPYQDLKNETVGLGAVDPVTFPAENLGDQGNRMQPGSGVFTETPAFVGGQPVGYFAYPVKTAPGRDPLRVLDNGKPYPPVATPTAYAFDAADQAPIPAQNKCSPPPGYKPDRRLDPITGWYKMQGNIFTDLPKATYTPGVASASTYVPVVAEARVSSGGHICQELKSEKGLSTARGGKLPKPTGNYLAWLIIDPAASVFAFDDLDQTLATSIVVQKWGWYNRYLLAYLDGGYIPTQDVQVMGGTMAMPTMKTVKQMVPQRLYIPRSPLMMGTMMVAAEMGQGYDVLTAARGMPGYSPICEVVTYDAKVPLPPEMLPKDAATIEAMFGPIQPATPHYVYCLQVR